MAMPQLPDLKQSLSVFFGIQAPEEVQAIAAHFTPLHLEKGDYLFEVGQKVDRLIFITEGYLRIFMYHGDKEITQWVASEGYFMTDLQGFFHDQAARFYMQTLSPLEGYAISKASYEALKNSLPKWLEFERHFLIHCMGTMENRILSHLSMSAEERYAFFWEHHRPLFLHVPHQYLASMLGMTPETFSRVRRKLLS